MNLQTGQPYIDSEAFEAIALALGNPAIEVRAVELRVPPGRIAYWLLIGQGSLRPPIYAKVQLGSGVVLARSFHYSDYAVR